MPDVPILALTATCTTNVLQSLATQFNMNCPVDGHGITFILTSLITIFMYITLATLSRGKTLHFHCLNANKYLIGFLNGKTLLFRAPLYRHNLHFKVALKTSTNELLNEITNYIMQNHAQSSGIIYCQQIKVRFLFYFELY